MGPPGIGKSFTALSLSMKHGFGIMSEDIVVTDGERIWPVPWTQTYRDYGKEYEEHIEKAEKIFDSAPVDKVFLIGSGERGVQPTSGAVDKMLLLNSYDIGYYCSPAMIALNYFNKDFSLKDAEAAERDIIKRLSENSPVLSITSDNAEDYCEAVFKAVIS